MGVRVTSLRSGSIKRVSEKMAAVLVRRGWVRDPEQPTTPTYQTRHMEAPVARTPVLETPAHVGFPGVDFASDRAYEVARDEPLPLSAFEGRQGTGRDGAFTTPDVRAIIAERAGG